MMRKIYRKLYKFDILVFGQFTFRIESFVVYYTLLIPLFLFIDPPLKNCKVFFRILSAMPI